MAAAMICACLGACLLVLMPPAADPAQAGGGSLLDDRALEIDLSAGWR